VVERLFLEGFACGSSAAVHRGKRLTASLPGGAATLSDFAPVVLIDFSGPGGHAAAVPALSESIGAGCGEAASFYQYFPSGAPFDLRGTSLRLTPDNVTAPSFYTVTRGTTPPDLSASALGPGPPNTSDDDVVARALGYSFPFPGGATGTIGACVNGYVWLSGSTLGTWRAGPLRFLGNTAAEPHDAMLAPFWHDFHAGHNLQSHPGSGMYVHTDASGGAGNTVTYVTWKEIGEYETLAHTLPGAQGFSVNTFQCVLHEATSVVEFRYGAMNGAWFGKGLTGFSRGRVNGVNAVDPMSRRLSVEVPFSTSPEGTLPSLGHGTSPDDARPILNRFPPAHAFSLTGFNHRPGTLLGGMVVDFVSSQPGIVGLLAPGCMLSLGTSPLTLQLFIAPSGTVTVGPIVMPLAGDPAAVGLELFSQYVTISATGALHGSNALRHRLGLR
jgi:hypothetical protein